MSQNREKAKGKRQKVTTDPNKMSDNLKKKTPKGKGKMKGCMAKKTKKSKKKMGKKY